MRTRFLVCCVLLAVLKEAACLPVDSSCGSSLCNSHGELSVTDKDFSCKCQPGFDGKRCENDLRPVCNNGGIAVNNGQGVFVCSCTDKFYGTNCEKSCPANFELLRSDSKAPVGCYSFVTAGKNYDQAGQNCLTLNAKSYLVVISSAEENTALKNRLKLIPDASVKDCGEGEFATSGQRDKINDCVSLEKKYNFYWKPSNRAQIFIKNGVSFEDWGSATDKTQPDCMSGTESCVTLWKKLEYGWNDYPCSSAMCSVCEVDL